MENPQLSPNLQTNCDCHTVAASIGYGGYRIARGLVSFNDIAFDCPGGHLKIPTRGRIKITHLAVTGRAMIMRLLEPVAGAGGGGGIFLSSCRFGDFFRTNPGGHPEHPRNLALGLARI
jgi:hypothetical protein